MSKLQLYTTYIGVVSHLEHECYGRKGVAISDECTSAAGRYLSEDKNVAKTQEYIKRSPTGYSRLLIGPRWLVRSTGQIGDRVGDLGRGPSDSIMCRDWLRRPWLGVVIQSSIFSPQINLDGGLPIRDREGRKQRSMRQWASTHTFHRTRGRGS